jgi:fructan beta-fructosidase
MNGAIRILTALTALAGVAIALACLTGVAGDTEHQSGANEQADPSQITIADFEGGTYGDWKATGTAFGEHPAKGTLPGQMDVKGFKGECLVNSFLNGDTATGTLTSPEFQIDRPFISFLIGGGGFAGKTCMNLIVDGKTVRSATGQNTHPGGSEELSIEFWDVSEFRGKTARIVIVDDATGGWGHINVDNIVQSDAKPRNTREIKLTEHYLLLPVRHGEAKRRTQILVDGVAVREFDIELSARPEWFAHVDVSAWIGKDAVVRAKGVSAGNPSLDLIAPSATIWNSEQLYREPLRPQIHFSSRRGWLNDPNGMVYSKGQYHLFYQHNPYGWAWGNMHWAHAVSSDLTHWEELPIALYPVKYGDWAFSGSAVVDKADSSGWKLGDRDVLVAAYTSTGRGECIVYSNDQGRTWTEYERNPVVKHAGRDPRLLWHEQSRQWVMAVYDEFEGKRWIAFHTSPDLKSWTFQSRIEGFFECPDIFELPVDGDDNNRKWVLTAADSDYMIGTFDGHAFSNETQKLKGNLGRGFYAAQTFSNDPKGRIVQIGWLQAPSPAMAFNQCMSIPIELKLVSTAQGPRLARWPVSELAGLREKTLDLRAKEIAPGANALAEFTGEILEVEAVFEPAESKVVEFLIRGIKVAYDSEKQELSVQERRVPAPLINGKQHLRLFLDRTVLEVFASDGLTYVPMPLIPAADNLTMSLSVRGGSAKFEQLSVHRLSSIHSNGAK